MPPVPFLFDAVLFDLDGTLVATDRYWPAAARVGARRAFDELGLDRAEPSDAEWMSMVGLPLGLAFERVFPDLDDDARAVVLERCREEEHELLRQGLAQPLPGALELLRELRAAGVKLGIASNCSQEYLESVTESVGIDELVHERRCLHSPGVSNKADMIADLLATFATRSAVMVGDRESDMHAAHAHGVPHVHLECGYAAGERFECEAVVHGLEDVSPLLRRRSVFLREALDTLCPPGAVGPATLGVGGPPGAGKTLLARDLERLVAAEGRSCTIVELDGDPGTEEPAVDARVVLDVGPEVALRRLASREGLEHGPARARARAAERWARASSRPPRPAAGSCLVLDGGNPLTLGRA